MTFPVYRSARVSARFFGERLDPLDVTLALRLPPDRTHRVGEPRLSRAKSGKVLERAPYRSGLWSISSEAWVRSATLPAHLGWILDQLEPRREAIAALLAAGHRGDLFCFSAGATPHPPAIPGGIRSRAEALGLPIGIDHYEIGETEPVPTPTG